MNCIHAFFFRERDDSRYVQIGFNGAFACADLVGFVGLETMQREPILLRIDGTVRSPSSFAARKMRMAISLRFAASSFRIDLVFFITVTKMCYAKFYIVSQTRRDAHAVFSMNGKSYFHELSGRETGRLRANELGCGGRGFL
jgi:hypothetical protein